MRLLLSIIAGLFCMISYRAGYRDAEKKYEHGQCMLPQKDKK